MPALRFIAAIVFIALGSGCAVTQVQTGNSIALKPATELSSAPDVQADGDPGSAMASPPAATAPDMQAGGDPGSATASPPAATAPDMQAGGDPASVKAPPLAATEAARLVTPTATRPVATQDAPSPASREVKDSLRAIPTIDLTAVPPDLWDRIRTGFSMPNLSSRLVQDRQIWYASQPSYVKRMVERSKRYLYYIVEELEKRGMPTELALLPMVESAFNPMAYSRSHASGLWQFMPSTGKNYNLQQNSWYDGRRDIVASTSAALDYLQFLYEMHGDWHLALASYNWGENAVARAIEKNKAKGQPTDYLSLTMPTETRYYLPKLQALKNLIANPHSFGVDLEPVPNAPYFVTVEKTPDMDVRLAAKLADMPLAEFLALNPGHNRPVIVANGTPALVLPADKAKIFLANLEDHDQPLVSWQSYTLRPGDKLDRIAAKSGISLARLKEINRIGRRTKVGPGFQLLLPLKGASLEPLPAMFQPPSTPEMRMAVHKLRYTVQRGDTLPKIAQRYKVSADDLRRWNEIGRLTAGQRLVIQVRQAAPVNSAKSIKKTRAPGKKK
ncbi:MAG: transglycosylase SLT domain-containing protein [Pseudomonadota bacterium]